jgi:hypothetical protein
VFYTNTEPVIYYTEIRRGVNIIHKCATGLSSGTSAHPFNAVKLSNQNYFFSITNANDGFLRITGLLAGEQVRIIDLRGRCLIQRIVPSPACSIDISELGAGAYNFLTPFNSQRLIIGR